MNEGVPAVSVGTPSTFASGPTAEGSFARKPVPERVDYRDRFGWYLGKIGSALMDAGVRDEKSRAGQEKEHSAE